MGKVTVNRTADLNFLAGGGEMGERLRSFDWTTTPLGATQLWPQSLKIAVRIMLISRQPIWIGWGNELTYLYNDPYKSIIGGKHPDAQIKNSIRSIFSQQGLPLVRGTKQWTKAGIAADRLCLS